MQQGGGIVEVKGPVLVLFHKHQRSLGRPLGCMLAQGQGDGAPGAQITSMQMGGIIKAMLLEFSGKTLLVLLQHANDLRIMGIGMSIDGGVMTG